MPIERVATLHGHTFSYTDSGQGPVLLFIHGILGSQRQWTHLVDRTNDDHRLLAPDQFGHGGTALLPQLTVLNLDSQLVHYQLGRLPHPETSSSATARARASSSPSVAAS